MLGWAIVLGLLFGIVGAGEYPEDRLRIVRNHINQRPASGDIVLVAIDEKSLREVGRWPWPRGRYASWSSDRCQPTPRPQVTRHHFSDKTDPVEDGKLATAIARSGKVTLGYPPHFGRRSRVDVQDTRPLPEFRKHAESPPISLHYNYDNEVGGCRVDSATGTKSVPSFAAVLAGSSEQVRPSFRVDYSVAPESDSRD